MPISPIATGTTRKITYTISFEGSAPDITSDTVSLTIKSARSDTDANAKLAKNADVATSGAIGKAIFNLTPTDTEIDPGKYVYDVIWYTGTDEYPLEIEDIDILTRVSDV